MWNGTSEARNWRPRRGKQKEEGVKKKRHCKKTERKKVKMCDKVMGPICVRQI
jgi:hypothetical protein